MSDKQHAIELLDRLEPGQLAAVVQLLETIVPRDEEDEAISVEEEATVARSKEWFRHHEGIPFEQIVAELGLTMDQIRDAASAPRSKDPAA